MDGAKNWVTLNFMRGGSNSKQTRRAPSTINVWWLRPRGGTSAYKTLLSSHPPPPLFHRGYNRRATVINWTGQNDPRRTRRSQALLVYCTIMKDGKHQFLTHNSERLVVNHILKNFHSISLQIIPVSSTKGQVSRSVWGTGHRVIRQPPEITGTCSALSSEMRIKCTWQSL